MAGQGDPTVLDGALVRICDLAGRPRGMGFAADDHGTVITSHEAVDGLARLVLHAAGERVCVVAADAVVALPEADLALVRTEGLDLRPLPVTVRETVPVGAYVRIVARGLREARVLGPASVTYTATDRFHLLDAAMGLAIGTDGADALRLGGGAAGGPVVDASSGAVLAVLGTALHGEHRAAGFAVPLREAAAADPGGPLAELLARNAATVPAYGCDLNLAGALHLAATSLGSDGPRPALLEPVERPDTTQELARFAAGPAQVLGLVGDPGTGRTTELAALAASRARGAEPAPTLWLRGADLQGTDTGVGDAVERALQRAGRILEASNAAEDSPADADDGLGDISAGRVARLVRDEGRALLLLLDGPEEMPPALAHRLAQWSEGTAAWLRETGARLVVGCRAEYWEQAGEHFPDELLPGRVHLGDLPERQARIARARYGIPDGALAAADARHPLALRLLADVRAALPEEPPPGRPDRDAIFEAYLDVLCLRVAVRLAAANGLRGAAVRRLAAKVSGQVHEAARRCLGPGQGELDRASFEEVFPWGTGWASAVLTEGLLVPAGDGYRFAHEELADWIQGMHLDVDGALWSLVHRNGPTPPSLPVPRHRIGPVVQALLLLGRQRGAGELAARLGELAGVAASGAAAPGAAASGGPVGAEGARGTGGAGGQEGTRGTGELRCDRLGGPETCGEAAQGRATGGCGGAEVKGRALGESVAGV
ncbi:serine protease, partial [Streptomyces sp. NPDC054878]